MQTLEQIVTECMDSAYVEGKYWQALSMEQRKLQYQKCFDKLSKLREDTIRQIEEYIENEINVVLGMSN